VKPKDIRKLRGSMTRETFSLLMGISIPSLWRWETGGSKPEGAALRLLEMVADERKSMIDLLSKYVSRRLRKTV